MFRRTTLPRAIKILVTIAVPIAPVLMIIGIDIKRYWISIFRTAMPLIIYCTIIIILKHLLHIRILTIKNLIIYIFLYIVIFIVITIFCSLTKNERLKTFNKIF